MRRTIALLGFFLLFIEGVMAETFRYDGTFRYRTEGNSKIQNGLKVKSNCSSIYFYNTPSEIITTFEKNPLQGLKLSFRYIDKVKGGHGYTWTNIVTNSEFVNIVPIDFKIMTCTGTPFINPPVILPVLNYQDFRDVLRSSISSNRISLFERLLDIIYTDFAKLDPTKAVGNSFGILLEIFEMSEQMGFEYISSEELVAILETFKPVFLKEFKGEKEYDIVLTLLDKIDILKFSRTKKGKVILSVKTKNGENLMIDAHTFPIKDKKIQEQVEKMFSYIKVKPDAKVTLYRDKNRVLQANFSGFVARVRVPFIGMKVNVHLHSGSSYLFANKKGKFISKFKVKIKKGIVGIPYTEKFDY